MDLKHRCVRHVRGMETYAHMHAHVHAHIYNIYIYTDTETDLLDICIYICIYMYIMYISNTDVCVTDSMHVESTPT